MKKILNVISSPRGAQSNSIRTAQALIEKLQAKYPGSSVKTTDLVTSQFPHLEASHLASFFTPSDKHTEKDREAIRYSDEAVRDIKEADILVIGAPMYNFTIHSTLKAWIDHIVRSGVTFSVSEKGAEGLIKGKKVYLIISSGWIYTEGPMKAHDYVEPYLRYILGFIGLTDITVLHVEGTLLPEKKEGAMERALDAVELS